MNCSNMASQRASCHGLPLGMIPRNAGSHQSAGTEGYESRMLSWGRSYDDKRVCRRSSKIMFAKKTAIEISSSMLTVGFIYVNI
jgi:hypothetical protein